MFQRKRVVLGIIIGGVSTIAIVFTILATVPPSWQGVGDWSLCDGKVSIRAQDAVRIATQRRGLSNIQLWMSGEMITLRAAFVNASGAASDVGCETVTPHGPGGDLGVQPIDGRDHYGWMVSFHEGGDSLTARFFLVDWDTGDVALSGMAL